MLEWRQQIVPAGDYHRHVDVYACVRVHVAGGDLYRRMVRGGGMLPEGEVCRDVVVPLLLTLTFLHANHIIHRWAVGSAAVSRQTTSAQ